MKITLILDETQPHKPPVGWKIEPENTEDDRTIAVMRDLQFFGIDDTHIIYDGLKLKNPDLGKVQGNVASLNYVQDKHSEEYKSNHHDSKDTKEVEEA